MAWVSYWTHLQRRQLTSLELQEVVSSDWPLMETVPAEEEVIGTGEGQTQGGILEADLAEGSSLWRTGLGEETLSVSRSGRSWPTIEKVWRISTLQESRIER